MRIDWTHALKMIGVAVAGIVLLPILFVPGILYISGCLLTDTEPCLFGKRSEEKT